MTSNAGETLGVYNDTGQPRGPLTLDESSNRNQAMDVRNSIRDNLASEGMARRTNNTLNGRSDRYNRMNVD